ncbi:MAG: two-component system, OmpR family, response regulator [Solirubrobacteraceae bacterium]|jgi:DNA-binding response OmpR family regulator|nr:two-component system, OmpR family, response regulator [Solirubrobacteraceae bacterium]
MRILVVEDEAGIADFVRRGLGAEGHQVEVASDGLDGERRALANDVDLVILDRMLPGRDGLEVLRGIRAAKPALPVIMLTARGEVADRVAGLDAGATDYLVKPFAFDELAARVRAHLRSTTTQSQPTRLEAAGIVMDLLGRDVRFRGAPIALSAKEFELLAHFLRHPNQVLSREQLLSGVWGYDHDPGTNIVEVYVGYLRRKLRAAGHEPPIDTLRSMGYRLTAR